MTTGPLGGDGENDGENDGGRDGEIDDGADPELAAFVASMAPAVHPVRWVLAAFTVLVAGLVLVPTWDALRFQLSRQTTVLDLGDAPPALLAAVPDGAWVRAAVVLGPKAAAIPAWRPGSLRMGPLEVRDALGTPLFVETVRARHPRLGPFVQTELEGRLATFADAGGTSAVHRYFSEELGVAVPAGARLLIVGEAPGQQPEVLWAWSGGLALMLLTVLPLARRVLARRRLLADANGR
jgi:hypothetical protein